MPISVNIGSFSSFGTIGQHTGSAPSPFDGLNGPDLAGPQGSHRFTGSGRRISSGPPTAPWQARSRSTDLPAWERDHGAIRLQASRGGQRAEAALRLVGLRLDEVARSASSATRTGTSPAPITGRGPGEALRAGCLHRTLVPPTLAPGETWEGASRSPRRRWPASAHLGESIVAWALECAGMSRWGQTTSSQRTCRCLSTRTSCAPAWASRAARA